jgi:hypothetical protein
MIVKVEKEFAKSFSDLMDLVHVIVKDVMEKKEPAVIVTDAVAKLVPVLAELAEIPAEAKADVGCVVSTIGYG